MGGWDWAALGQAVLAVAIVGACQHVALLRRAGVASSARELVVAQSRRDDGVLTGDLAHPDYTSGTQLPWKPNGTRRGVR